MMDLNRPRMKINRHPIIWVQHILDTACQHGQLSRNAELVFSKYKYIPQTYEDIRVNITLPISDLNNSFLLDELMDLDSDEEIAINSTIYDRGIEYHIPLLDFGGKDSRLFDYSFKDFSRYWNMNFSIYSSGRSYHAYGNRLIYREDWIKFMGSSLLLNIPGGSKIIDDRWVGHRILAGYSALRWSKNSNRYKKYPTYIGCITPMGFYDNNINTQNIIDNW